MVGLGITLLLVGIIFAIIVFIGWVITCWQISPSYTLLSFIPFVGLYFYFALLFKNWHELKGLFFAGIIANLIMHSGSFCVGMGRAQAEADDPQIAENDARYDADTVLDNMERQREQERRDWESTRSHLPNVHGHSQNNGSRRNTPPPKPDNPIFKPDALVAGLSNASSAIEAWPEFASPELDLSEGKAIDLHGYEILVPDIYEVKEVQPIADGQGTQWRIVGGELESGRPIELTARVTTLPQQGDGRVFAPSWSETISRAGVNRSSHSIQYGKIGEIPFARCADELVRSGHGVGKVLYLGQPAPDNPQQIEIEFATDPQGFGPSYALMCEAIVRSLRRSERVLMEVPANPMAVPSELSTASTVGLSSADWHVRGPLALPLGEHGRATMTPWSRDGSAWQTRARINGAREAGIEITLQQDDIIAVDRIRPVAIEGPLRTDAVVCAYGGDARYVRLWNDEVFARIEHNPQQHSGTTYRRVTYHGYLNQYRVDITVTNRDDSEVTMAELQDYVLRSRLATLPELADRADQSQWLKDEVLGPDRPQFFVANGIDITQGLLLDERGQIALSPQYDPETQRMFEVFPKLEDADVLAEYESWTSEEQAEDAKLLGKAEKLDALSIQPIKELRASHRSKQLSWQAKTKAGTVGMTVHVEDLKPTDHTIQTPILEVAGRTRIRLGRRMIQPSQTPDITYRELRNVRVWRVNVPPSGRQEVARCHYLAIVPGKMIVISATYLIDRPEQLGAFDASVATLVYQDGESLKLDAPVE